MKIGIFGDSFATGDVFHDGTSWPRILAEKLHCKYDVFAHGGSSLYYSYGNFINNYKKYSHVVFVYTEYMRLNTMPNHLAQFSNTYLPDLEHLQRHYHLEIDDLHKEELFSIVKARQYTDDETFSKFIYQTIFNNVNEICKDNGIRLVNIHPFEAQDNEIISLGKREGTCLLNLQAVSASEISHTPETWTKKSGLKDPSFKLLLESVDVRPNHLNSHNNQVLADVISSSFVNNNQLLDLTTVDTFCYNTDLVIELIEKYGG